MNMMQVMNSKCKRSYSTSASNSNKVRAKENAIANIRDLFRDSSTKLYVPAFTAWRISLFIKDLSTKEPPQNNYNGLHKTRVHSSNSQSSTQEVAQSQLGL